ncbi:MAG: GNAT family N-acetyltransferase [Bacteroidetes bacterium]|nr:GNAT family N-acetyltransferase [Bacteroidota bacterium]
MEFELLHTERLILRKIDPDVYTWVFTQLNREEQKQFLGFLTDEELDTMFAKYQKGFTCFNKTYLSFQLLDKITGDTIGVCGYHNWYTEHRRAEIGYSLYQDVFKRQGYMSEAFSPIIKYGFEQMQLNRIEAFIGPHNTASIKLVEKNGFTPEGHLKQHYYKNGIMEDSLVFALLLQNYKP